MSSQQSNPTEGHSPATEPNSAKAKTDKAKKWAAFKTQNYDGEGWGDDYEDGSGSPQSPPHRGVSLSHSPTTVPSDNQPQVSNGLASSLPSQIQAPQITPELGRAAAATAPNPKRASGIYSGFNQSTLSSGPEFGNIAGVEQMPSSAIPQVLATVSEDGSVSPPQSQSDNVRDPRTTSNAPTTTPMGEPGQPPHAAPEKRYSTSPQLPDLARMSMFGDDFFKTSSLDEGPPPLMPSLPPSSPSLSLGIVKHPDATAVNVAPASSAAPISTTPPLQAPPALGSPPLKAQPLSPISSGDIAVGDSRAAAQLDASTNIDISQKHPVAPAVSEVGKSPALTLQPSDFSSSGMAGQVTTAHPALTSDEALASNQQTRELSPPPLRSMGPFTNTAESMASSGNESVQEHIPANVPSASPEIIEPAGNHDEPQPGPYHRQSTMDTTTTASSVPKESDKLHDEIFHSLAPPGESGAYQRKSTIDGIRESTYLPSVYDDYWATTAEDQRDPAVPDVLHLPAGATIEAAVAPLRPGTKSPGPPASPPPLRKRFSWEQNVEADAVPPASRQPQSSQAPAEPSADVSHSPVQEAGSPPKPEEGKATEAGTTEGSDSEQGLTGVSRHGSQVSKTKVDDNEELSTEQNRLSLAGEKLLMGASDEHLPTEPILEDHPALRDSARYSPEQSIHDPVQDMPKELPRDTLTSKSANLPSFREIMALGTSRERTAKFNETRSQFAGIDEGLSDWIATLKDMPEHAGASVIFNANGSPAPISSTPSAQGQQSHTAVTPGQPQPYIGASSPTGGAFGRPISTSLGSSTPASVFKHSSNQAGVKSKELLLAAGKAGKGLLSKGKNKLRGSTGDKNDSSPSQSQPNPPSDGRTSWGVKFVAGAGGPARSSTPPSDPVQQLTATASSAAPHLPTARPGPDGATLASLQPPPTGSIFADPELVSPVSDINSRISSDGDDVFAPQSIKVSNSTPVDKPQPWVPATGSPLAVQGQLPIATGLRAPGDDGATEEAKSDKSNDWAATSPHLLPEHARTGAHISSEDRSVNRPERVSDTDTAGHAPMGRSDDPKRALSFTGLPPIRRSSTFGLALGETVRVGEDDCNDENRETHESQVDVIPTISDAPPESDVRSDEPVEAATLEGQTLGNDYPTTEGAVLELVKQKNLSDGPSEQPAAVDKSPTTGDAVTAAAPSSDEPPTLIAPADPTSACITSGEQPPVIPPTSEQQSSLSSAGPSLVRSPPPHITVSPIQKLPPNGQWKMQESYLSEPLISPSRKRPSSVSSQSPSFVGFEKETGMGHSEERVDSSDDGSIAGKAGKAGSQKNQKQVHQQEDSLKDTRATESRVEGPLPSAASLAPAGGSHSQPLQPGTSGRQKYGATPPVAMQRYRGLFAPKQPPMQVYTHPPEVPSQTQLDVAECSGALPPHTSGGPPARPASRASTADGKGRRSSGIFGPIGDRFAKMNTDLASPSEPNRAGEAANDGASETSIPAVGQRHRRRSSFFLNLRGSNTQNPGHQTGDSMAAISPSMVDDGSQPSPPPEERHKRSFFSTGKGRISTGVSSRFPPVLSRSSTTSVEGNAAKEQRQGQGKARFGGFGMFKRPTGLQDSASLQEKPGSAGSMVPSIQSRPATGTVAPPEPSIANLLPTQASSQPQPQGTGSLSSLPAPPTRGRSGTTGSIPGSSGPSPLSQATTVSEERGRRVSGPGAFLSNVWANRSSSKSDERGSPAGGLPQGQLGPHAGPQYGPPPGRGTPLGLGQMHPAHQGRAPPPFTGPQQQGPPGPYGRSQYGPTHQRQASAPEPADSSTHNGPVHQFPPHRQQISVSQDTTPTPDLTTTQGYPATPTQRQSPLDKLSPGQQIIMSTAQKNQLPLIEQANQGQQMQDWRPVPVQQPEAAGPSAEPASKDPSQGRALVERGSHRDLAHVGLVGGADTAVSEPRVAHDAGSSVAPPVETSAEKNGTPLQDAKAEANASDATATTPNTAHALTVDEQTDKDVASSLSSTDAPSTLPSLTRPSATLTPQQASPSSQQDLPKNLQREGSPISATESIKLDLRGAPASSTELVESDPSRSPQVGSASTQSPHLSPSKHRTSTGHTIGQPASPAVEQAVARAGQGQEQLAQAQALPQGQLPSQLRPGQLPGQPLRGQPHPSYALQPNAQQGQWRPFVPQEPIPPNQLHGQPPWAMNRPAPEVSNAFGPQHVGSPARFHAVAGPSQSPQPQRNEGQSSMSKWFKGVSSGQPQRQQTQQQPVQAKPEKPKSLFSAFKRPSKQADTRPPETTQPQFVPGQGQHPVFASGGYPQQYHPQQFMDPAWAMVPSQHQHQMGQYRPAMPHQGGQQFAQAAYQLQPAPGQVLYTPGQPTQLQQHTPNQDQDGPSITPSRQTSMASSNQPRISVASESPIVQSPHPIGTQINQGASTQPAVPHASQLPQATVPTTQFSKDPRPSVSTDVNKPLPIPRLLHQQERVSDVSQTSSISSAPTPPAEGASTTVAALEQAVRSLKPVDRKTLEHDDRTYSQSSLAPSVAASSKKLTVDTDAAKRRSNETNLYDATPRGIPAETHDATPTSGEEPSTGLQTSSRSPGGAQDSQTTVSSGVQVQAPPRTPSAAQDSQTTTVPEEASDDSQPTQPADPLSQPTDQATQHTQTNGQAEPIESKQQAIIRKMRLDAQEEKILVPGQDGLPGAAEQDDDRPHMSATSYPGQEWNPYGGGYDFYQD